MRITNGFDDLSTREQDVDPYWSYRILLSDQSRGEDSYHGWIRLNYDTLASELEFLCSAEGDTVAHALAPFADGCTSARRT